MTSEDLRAEIFDDGILIGDRFYRGSAGAMFALLCNIFEMEPSEN